MCKYLLIFETLLILAMQGVCGDFFRIEKSGEGRWFLVDPAGERFFATGVDQISFYLHPCAKRGGMPYHDNVLKHFGSERAWAEDSARRMRLWGFNTVGISDKPGLMRKQGFAFPVFTAIGSAFAFKSALKEPADWRNFPNVFDPGFEAGCLELARSACAPWRGNTDVIGYFIDNELQWGGRDPENSNLFDDVMQLSAGNPAKVALRDFLREKYAGNLTDFCHAWGVTLASWEAFLNLKALPVPAECSSIRDAFLGMIAERYYCFTTKAIRTVDPDHLILGNRYAGTAVPDWVLRAAGKYCDVISVNAYPVIDFKSGNLGPVAAEFDRIHRITGRPLYLTEWSFPALDSGLPSSSGGGMRVDTQAQRAECARLLQTLVFSLPYFIGSNYFMWVDQSPWGRPGFAENCNYGLVREDDSAYAELTGMFAKLNPAALAIHAGTGRDFVLNQVIRDKNVVVCEIRHFGALPQEAELRLSGGGVSRIFRMPVAPGKTTSATTPFLGDGPVTVEILNSESVRGARRMTAVASGVWWENRSDEAFRGGAVIVDGEPMEIPPLRPWEIRERKEMAVPAFSLELTENNAEFSFANSMLSVRSTGTNGNLIDEIRFGGRASAGRVAPMLQWNDGKEQWQAASRPGPVRVIRREPFVELEVIRRGCGEKNAMEQWELTTRIYLFGNTGEIWLRPVAVRNTGSVPLRIGGFLFQPYPASSGARTGRFSIPYYYRAEQRNVWENPDGTRLGAWSPDGSMKVRFWQDDSGGFHPDARIAVEPRWLLAPGECRKFLGKSYLVLSNGEIRGGNPQVVQREGMKK